MGIHSGKFYDARKMRDFCDSLKQAAADFDEKATATHANYNSFFTTEAFMGMTADEAKNFVKNGLGNMLKTASQTHKQMVDTQTELITMFEEMVDPSQNARIEYDTLDKINRDFKEMYYIYKDSAERVRRIVNNLNAEFGSYAYFEQPDSKSGLDAMIAFCGGEDETAGYIKSCQNKLVAYDEAAKAKLNSMDTIEKATKVDTCITDTRAVLSAMPMRKSDSSSTVINCVDNTKATKSKTNKNIKKNEKEEMYDYLKEYYGFSDEEMEYLKENYPGLLSSLYGASKYSTSDAKAIYKQILKKLDNKAANICNNQSRRRIPEGKLKYYDHNVTVLQSINTTNNGKFTKELESIKNIYDENKNIYLSISERTGIPPELICAIHYRESGCNFNTYLHNGDPLGSPTVHEPKGVMFDNFEDAAVDALTKKKKDTGIEFDKDTDIASYMTYAEAFNGYGYANKDKPSPYLYSGTDVYVSGKYTTDHGYDENAVDKQVGVFSIIEELKSE